MLNRRQRPKGRAAVSAPSRQLVFSISRLKSYRGTRFTPSHGWPPFRRPFLTPGGSLLCGFRAGPGPTGCGCQAAVWGEGKGFCRSLYLIKVFSVNTAWSVCRAEPGAPPRAAASPSTTLRFGGTLSYSAMLAGHCSPHFITRDGGLSTHFLSLLKCIA